MTNIEQVIEELNSIAIIQKQGDFLEDLSEEIWKKYFQDPVDEGLNVEKHRWYETSISVYKIGEDFLGVRAVTDVFSEQSEVGDMFHQLKFFQMVEVLTPSYKIKK